MANVGHCVVITAEILVEATNKLKELGYHDLAKKIIANHKPLKPIVKDAYSAGCAYTVGSHELMQQTHKDLNQYLTDTEL